METYKRHILPIQTGILVGVVVTAILFMGLPLLTQMQRAFSTKKESTRILISSAKPPPPPEPERDKKELEKPEKKAPKKTTAKKLSAVPKIEVPSFNMPGAAISGSISIGGLSQTEFNIDASLFATAFELSQVDQKPSVLRSIPPTYPFLAKRKNIEGQVMLRFVVDKDGYAQEPEVFSAEPEGAGFEEAALKAIARYKFKPAIKDGEAVDCIVRLPISFELR
jgi:protein TonB